MPRRHCCTACCGKSILRDISVTFLYISLKPHFDLEPDYIVRKPIKRRFQQYLVRTEIVSTFHTRVEYISRRTIHHFAHSNQWYWVLTDTQTDTQTLESENSILHCFPARRLKPCSHYKLIIASTSLIATRPVWPSSSRSDCSVWSQPLSLDEIRSDRTRWDKMRWDEMRWDETRWW